LPLKRPILYARVALAEINGRFRDEPESVCFAASEVNFPADFINRRLQTSGDDIIRIDDKFEASSVAKKINYNKTSYLASDGRTLLYMKNDDLYKADALNKNATAVKLVDGNVSNFEAVNKGSAV
jgi:hypothetical protein